MPEISEYIIVAEQEYEELFPRKGSIAFASPGLRRQDSVYNGLQKTASASELILVHDSARPFIEKSAVYSLLEVAKKSPAACLANPVKSTIRKAKANLSAGKALPREELWEMQPPQAVEKSLLIKGFQEARKQHCTVTDDVALAELVGGKPKLVPSSDVNMKITTPFDYLIAKKIYEKAL